MKKYIKPILWIAAASAAILAFLFILLLLAPFLINLEPAKQRVVADISQAIGGRLEARRINLHFFPRPSIILQGGIISVPEKVSGTFDSLSIYPEITMLLRGKVRIARLILAGPDMQVSLPDDLEKMEGLKQFSLKAIDDELASIMAKVASEAPGLVLSIEKGSLNLLRQRNSAFWFHDIYASIALPGKQLGVELACSSNIWRRASLAGWLKPGEFRGEGRIQLTQLRPDLIAQNLFPRVEPRIEESQANLEISFGADGIKSSHAEFQSDVPSTTLRRGQQSVTLRKVSLKGTLRQDGDKTIAFLTELDSVYPQMTVSGNLNADAAPAQASLDIRASAVDVESVRSAALFLLGRQPVVQSIFDILRKGSVPALDITSRGSTLRDLAKEENIVIQGSMTGGTVVLRENHLDLEEVKGNAVISRGVLEGKDLEARLGNAWGTAGLLRVDFKSEPTQFRLDIGVKADIAELPFYLKNLIGEEGFTRELDLIKELRGGASGRLVLDRRASGTQVSVDVQAFTLYAAYQRFPFPLELHGKFSYDGPAARIMVDGLSGRAGKSSFSQLTGQLTLEGNPFIKVTSGSGTILLDEFYPWLLGFEPVQNALGKGGSVKGILTLDTLQLQGPLSQPKSWQFQAVGHVQNVAVASPRLPVPVEITSGNFEAGPEQLSLSNVQTSFQDSSLSISGVLYHYLEELDRADLSLQGQVGAESTLRISDLMNLPQELRYRSPFYLSQAHLVWEKSGRISWSGNARMEHGPDVSVDAVSEPDELTIKRMVIRDAKSDASLFFHLKARELGLTFNGTLTGTTLDDLLERNEFLTGWLKGNLSAHIDLDQPFNSVAQGALQGDGLTYPYSGDVPVQIDAFSVTAKGNLFTVDSNLHVSGHSLKTKGEVDFLLDGFMVDMDISMNGFDLDHVMTSALGKKRDGASRPLPLKGILRVESEYVKYGRFTWRPVRANITFDPETTRIEITQANLCGIDTPGLLEISPKGVELRTKPKAKDKDLHETLICLSDTRDISGHFSFNADVSGKGEAESLARSLKGTMELEAKNGRIHRWGFLAKIFEVLSPTGLLRIPDLTKEGLSYYTIKAEGNLQDGKIAIKEALVDASSADLVFNGEIDLIDRKIDAVVLVLPFRTIDRIINFIPLVRYILAGRLVAIPVRVSGDLDKPDVIPFSPSAVGAGLLDTVKRIFHLPFHLIQPLLPREKQD
ncbi:MAG TPA: AsmA-like C-terminal domain-containing protein [Syntrophorhabdales bacterium]|nr:AsmA-like C-terminal domain-containing protein [Syntrophorhabdales bacterium]